MDPMLILGLFLIGGACGCALGKIKTVEVLGPVIHQMSERIEALEAELLEAKAKREETQIETLERWMRQ